MASATWADRMSAAEARGCFTEDDRRESGDFRTCAVGERGRAVGVAESVDGPAWNSLASDLGLRFWSLVWSQDVATARGVFEVIQRLGAKDYRSPAEVRL